MSRRSNHRGWIVLVSVPSADGSLCIDFFEHPDDGGFGFEHFRSDPEDSGRWTAIGGFGGTHFETAAEAVAAARDAVAWLGSTEVSFGV